jgi:hypothetical protein
MAVLSAEQVWRFIALSRITHANASARQASKARRDDLAASMIVVCLKMYNRALGDACERMGDFVAWSRSRAWRAKELQDRPCADDLAGLARREAVR